MMGLTAEEFRIASRLFEPRVSVNSEDNPSFDFASLNPGYVSDSVYYDSRATLVRGCADGLLACLNEDGERGILLITRKGAPAKGKLWSIGGGIQRGVVGVKEALNANAARECALNLSNHVYLGSMDFAWSTTPSESDVGGRGIRDLALMYYAHGEGTLKFKDLDNDPVIVTPRMWEQRQGKLKELHPYIDKSMHLAMILLIDDFYK
jgi:hypothetical protein